ncbi:MAG: apolipoprotein N-acyltransferase [Paracoccus sp. (in: a-proteobacteria)]|nr:apolipoprotein N-acyltransferase [Paracoccus sp. (in: a-proteobacteria)]
MTASPSSQTPPSLHRRGRPPLRQLWPDLVLGAVGALGLAPFGIWAATPIAFAILIWRLARLRPAAVFWHALVAGFGWFAVALFWIVEPFLVEPETYGWMAPFALVLMALGGALFWAIPGWLAAIWARNWRMQAVGIAVALALSDWLRGWLFTGFPWALIGHAWIDTPVAQLAAWGGPLGLSTFTLALGTLPALLWRPSLPRATACLIPAFAAIVALGGAWAFGLARLAAPSPAETGKIIRIVQPNATQHLKWDPEWSQVFFDRLLDLSSEPGPHDLVIWPETAVNFLLEDANPILPAMSQAANAPLVMGIQRRDGSRYYNSLAVVEPGGELTQTYDKFHLVPFGEYVPWGDTLAKIGIGAFAAQQGNGYSSGTGPQVIQTGDIPPFQPLICYEAIFPQHLRNLTTRPAWILQATNDAWFGNISGPYQHLAQARLRAIESGLPVARAANTGVSAMIDAKGRIRDSLDMQQTGKMDVALPSALPATFWIRTGNAPLLVLLSLLMLATLRLKRR